MNSTTTPEQSTGDASLRSARAWFAAQGLTRPQERRVIAGVSAGLARRYGVDRLVMRIAMVAGLVILTPLIYVGLWILMPSDA